MHCDFCDGWSICVLVLDVPSWSVCVMNHIVRYKAGENGIRQNGKWTYYQAHAMVLVVPSQAWREELKGEST